MSKVTSAALPKQASADDLESLDKYQKDAFGTVDLQIGTLSDEMTWECSTCRMPLSRCKPSDVTRRPNTAYTAWPVHFFRALNAKLAAQSLIAS